MIDRDSYERLYLMRDEKEDIFVDLPQLLPQHQLDGIRYLYWQFRKKIPGVILNDPSGYGKCLQVVLFLSAVRPLLDKPILILCADGLLQNWKEHFEIWTSCLDEVAIKSSNPYSTKSIYISPLSDGLALSRRAWGAVVVQDGGLDALRLNIDAQYKIWVTSENLKEDLKKLSQIYSWLHPKCTMNLAQFETRPNDPNAVAKSLLLDVYLEDFLLRRKDFFPLFQKAIIPEPPATESPKISRKNKDPTGTKVKRSKKRKIEDEYQEAIDQKIPNDNKNDDNSQSFNFTTQVMVQNPTATENVELLNNNSVNMNVKDEDCDESLTLEYQNAIYDIVRSENEALKNKSDAIATKSDNDDIPMTEVTTSSIAETGKEGLEENEAINSPKRNEHEKLNQINDNIKTEAVELNVVECNTSIPKNDIQNDTVGTSKIPESVIQSDTVGTSEIPVKDEDDDDLERKLKEFEQKALNRFKGSFLDKIF